MAHSAPSAFRRILVLCEGNHCRSPIAEVLLKTALGAETSVESAGLDALVGRPADAEAQSLMAERGLDISNHRGRQLTAELALSADLILVMDLHQKETCERLIPSTRGRVFLLGQWLPATKQEILDPFCRDTDTFRSVLNHIDQSVTSWLSRLAQRSRYL